MRTVPAALAITLPGVEVRVSVWETYHIGGRPYRVEKQAGGGFHVACGVRGLKQGFSTLEGVQLFLDGVRASQAARRKHHLTRRHRMGKRRHGWNAAGRYSHPLPYQPKPPKPKLLTFDPPPTPRPPLALLPAPAALAA